MGREASSCGVGEFNFLNQVYIVFVHNDVTYMHRTVTSDEQPNSLCLQSLLTRGQSSRLVLQGKAGMWLKNQRLSSLGSLLDQRTGMLRLFSNPKAP